MNSLDYYNNLDDEQKGYLHDDLERDIGSKITGRPCEVDDKGLLIVEFEDGTQVSIALRDTRWYDPFNNMATLYQIISFAIGATTMYLLMS